ncbi:Cytochrome C oxidase Cbb3 [Flavobacterium longum]|uniref:FixH family protein n=1 Tax=Flavobacterium longum TaxID=1299340 RepID=UPI0039E953F4
MKINWGHGIVIAFALFMSFILYFVIEVQSDTKYDNELVVEEYYKKDTRFGEELAKLQAGSDLAQKPEISSDGQGIQIQFPETPDFASIVGKVSLYRPSASKLDFEVPFSSRGHLLIPSTRLVGGQWDITLEWTSNGKTYIIKKKIYRS